MKLIFGLFTILVIVCLTITLPRSMAEPQSAARPLVVEGYNCVHEYNALLLNAKAALQRGDRVEALNLLQGAKRTASQCPDLQEPQESMVLS